jgi:coenzyme F420-reducing hydrogenase gamma subunit
MSKPRVAIFDFACCEGCQLQIVNMEDELLDLLEIVEPVTWREAMTEESEDFDIALIEGSITRPQDEERLKKIREKADVLVALGACATIGGVNRIKNNFDLDEVKEYVYGVASEMPHLETARTKAAHEVVDVEYKVHQCPMNKDEFAYIIRCLALGKEPKVPDYPVCVECKANGTVCRWEYGEVCLGVVTRAGCGAPCPSNGLWCFGCRGLAPDNNVPAAQEIMDDYGLTVEDLKEKLILFNSETEHTQQESADV